MVKIRKDLVPASLASKVTYDGKNTCKYIIMHETGNTSEGADAESHANLQKRDNNRDASWQYQVDEKEAVQSFEDTTQCWAAGSPYYNRNGINIEMCVNKDGNFKKTVSNAAELVKVLMKRHGIPKENVLDHKKTSGWKDCPHYLRSGSKGVNWNDFMKMIDGVDVGSVENADSAPAKESKPSSTGKPDYNTNSIVDFLNSVGESASFANREKLAKKHGISNYEGTASQNTNLLEKLKKAYKGGSSSSSSAKKGDQKTNSIVEYLNSIGESSSFSNREKLAKKYGISNYSGTASQNLKLLDKLRSGSKPAPAKKGDQKTNSIVDYLVSINESSSFANREKLAKKHGISNYKGTASQNTALLKKMRGH